MDELSRDAADGEALAELMRHLAAVKRGAQQAASAGWTAAADADGELLALARAAHAQLGILLGGLRGVSQPGEELSPSQDLEVAFEELQVADEELRLQNEELLRTRDALEAERRRYRELFDFAPDGSLVTDFSGVVQEANRAAGALLGVEPHFLVGEPLWLYVAQGERPAFIANLEGLVEGAFDQTLRWDASMQSRQGRAFQASLAVAPVHDAAERPAGLRWLIRDVTRRRRNEEMLKQQAEELQRLTESLERRVQERTAELASAYTGVQTEIAERKRAEDLARAERQRLNDILEVLPAYVILLTPDYRVSVANRFFRQRFGESRGGPCYEYLFGREAPCERCETYSVLKTGGPHRWEWVGPDGRTYDVFDFPFTDSDGTTLILEMGIDITERVQAERALQEANEMLERRVAERTTELTNANAELAETRDYLDNLLSYANAPIVVWDPALRITRFNAAFERLTGLEAGAAVGQTLDILFPQQRKEEAMVQIQRASTGERWEVVEIPILHVDGTVRTVLWNSATVYAADGITPLATIAQGHDISERKRAEEELLQREEQLRVITDSVPVLIGYVDREQRYRFANKQYEAWFGQPGQQVIGQKVQQLLGDKAYETLWPYMERALAGKAVRFQQWVPYQGAGLRYVDSAYVPSLDAEGSVQGYYVLVSDDTERQRNAQERERLLAEVQKARDEMERRVKERTAQLAGTNEVLQAEIRVRRQIEDELRESELRFRQLAENIDEAFWLLESDSGRFLYVNPVWQRLWNRAGDDVNGWPALFEAVAHPEDRQRLLAAWQADGARFDQEFRIIGADGEERWVRGRAFPVPDSEGRSRRVAGIIQDITAQKGAQAALIQAERMSTAGRLAASLGHEINNPLQSAIGCLDLAREAMEEGRDPARFLQVTCDALERAAWVVSQLRALHRDATREARKQVSLQELLHNVLLLSRKQCATQGIEVLEEFGDELPPLSLMPNALQQVFLNLVLNAIDAMPEGGELRVSIEPSSRPEGVCVRFADTGRGLSPEVQEHLFEPFHTTKSEGLGLGLFISQDIVQQHGGRIEARPGKDRGSVFSVFIPQS